MTDSYKRAARRRTAQRVEEKTQALDPAAGLDRELGDRIERDDDRVISEADEQKSWLTLLEERDDLRRELETRDRNDARQDVEWQRVREEVLSVAAENERLRGALEALKSDPRLVSPPVEGRSQDTTTDESESRGGT